MIRPVVWALALAAVVGGPLPPVRAAGPGQGQGQEPARPAAVVPSPSPSPSPRYVIGVGDVLKINVWKEPDLTMEVSVRPDGMITVPLLGDVAASGRTPASLAGVLLTELQQLIENPRVTVSVSQATSARVYVIGQMARPGEFPLLGRMTVLKALALAGGFKDFAKPDGIVIIREDQTVIPFNYKRVTDGRDVSQNVLLAAGDTIVVP
jgi:polysaccharide export outer membrane protein